MNGREVQVDNDDDGSGFTTIKSIEYVDQQGSQRMTETKELTDEERGQQAAEKQRDILAKAAEERRVAKEAMLARNAARVKELGSKLKPGETLEQYDDRVKGEK